MKSKKRNRQTFLNLVVQNDRNVGGAHADKRMKKDKHKKDLRPE